MNKGLPHCETVILLEAAIFLPPRRPNKTPSHLLPRCYHRLVVHSSNSRSGARRPRVAIFTFGLLFLFTVARAATDLPSLIVTNNLKLDQATLRTRLVVRASYIVIDGNGATLQGPGTLGDTNSIEHA